MRYLSVTLAFLGLFLLPSCQAEPTEKTIKVKIEKTWTIDMAREEAFRDAPKSIDLKAVPQNDPNFLTNGLHNGSWKNAQWQVTTFDGGVYTVAGLCAHETFAYSYEGVLALIDISDSPPYGHPVKCPQQFPIITKTYAADDNPENPKGNLLGVRITPRPGETFTFDNEQKLSAHHLGGQCYLPDGTLCGKSYTYYVK